MTQKFPQLEIPIFEDYYGEFHKDSFPVTDAKVYNLKSNCEKHNFDREYIISTKSVWYNPNDISDIERNAFPELLASNNNENTYKEGRNNIIEEYRKLPGKRLSIKEAKLICNFDIVTLMKIVAFLEKHELINYNIDEFNCIKKIKTLTNEVKESQKPNLIVDYCDCGSKTDLHISKKDFQNICEKCLEKGMFNNKNTFDAFVKFTSSYTENMWTRREETKLINMVDMGCDWDHISNDIGKTYEQCMIKYLSLDTKIDFINNENQNAIFDAINNLPNPVMNLIALVCGSVSPKIASVIAKWVLMNIEQRNMVTSDLIEICKENAMDMKKLEETRLEELQHTLVELQKSKLNLKLNEYEELTCFVENERNDYEYTRKTCINEFNKLKSLYK